MTPAYVPVYTWNGGVYGDDQILAKTNVLVDDHGIGDYTPRNQDDKAIALGIPIVTDITSPRGTVSPREPYPHAGSPAEPAPTIASLNPNTAVAGDPSPLSVVVTGTNFTPYTVLIVGNIQTPYVQYASPTKMVLLMDPARSTRASSRCSRDHSVGARRSTSPTRRRSDETRRPDAALRRAHQHRHRAAADGEPRASPRRHQGGGDILYAAMHNADGSAQAGDMEDHHWSGSRMKLAADLLEMALMMARKAALG